MAAQILISSQKSQNSHSPHVKENEARWNSAAQQDTSHPDTHLLSVCFAGCQNGTSWKDQVYPYACRLSFENRFTDIQGCVDYQFHGYSRIAGRPHYLLQGWFPGPDCCRGSEVAAAAALSATDLGQPPRCLSCVKIGGTKTMLNMASNEHKDPL